MFRQSPVSGKITIRVFGALANNNAGAKLTVFVWFDNEFVFWPFHGFSYHSVLY